MANVKITELGTDYLPSTSAKVVGVDEKKTVNFPVGALGEAVTLTPAPTDTLLSIRTSLLDANKNVLKPTLVQFKGAYTRALIIWFEGNMTSEICTMHCWDLTNRKTYTAKNKLLPSITLQDFFSSTYEVALGSGSIDNSVVTVIASSVPSMQKIYDDIVSAGKEPTEPTLVQLQASYNNLLLMWIVKSGADIGYVYCWDLKNGKFYRTDSPVLLTTVFLDDLFNNYEVSLGSGGSGDSSIIDLGEQGDHKEAQSAMVDYAYGLSDEEVCLLFKYSCSCSGSSCFAIVRYCNKGDYRGCRGVVYNNYREFREFAFDTTDGFFIDGCWEQLASANDSGEATLSMPRIRLSNWYYGEIPVYDDIDCDSFISGRIVFSVNVQDGTVQEGDQLQVCSMRKVFGKTKLRPILSRYITSEDIENLAKQPYLQISTDDMAGNNLSSNICYVLNSFYLTDSKLSEKAKPKYIRIRRPVWGTNRDGEEVEVSASFSNVEPVHIHLRYVLLSEQSSESEE